MHKFLIERMDEDPAHASLAQQSNSHFKLAKLVISRNEKTTRIRMQGIQMEDAAKWNIGGEGNNDFQSN